MEPLTMDYYGTLNGFVAYHVARGRIDVESMDDDEVLAALLIASEWGDARYRERFNGQKVGAREQVREWPRYAASDRFGHPIAFDTTPVEMENAVYEAAYRQMKTPGSLSVDWTPGKYESVSVAGAVAIKYTPFNSASDIQTRFTIIDEVIGPILTKGDTSGLSGGTSRQ
jgi:hypothetical protein